MGLDRETASFSLKNINKWIQNCDTKTSIAVGLYGVMITAFFTNKNILDLISKTIATPQMFNSFTIVMLIIFVLFALISGIGIYKFIRVLIPRIDLTYDSIFFFGTVAKHSYFDEYATKVTKYNEESILNDILKQNYVAAKICTKKFQYFKEGLQCFSTGLVLFCLFIIIYILSGCSLF